MEGILLRREDDKRYLRFFLDNGSHYCSPRKQTPFLTSLGHEFKWRKHSGTRPSGDMNKNFKVGGPKCLIKW